jgi:hypothetical protein
MLGALFSEQQLACGYVPVLVYAEEWVSVFLL